MIKIRLYFLFILLSNILLGFENTKGKRTEFTQSFEIGTGLGYFMPRTVFTNSQSFTISSLWKMTPTYGIRLNILNTALHHNSVDSSRNLINISPGVELTLKVKENAKGYTLIDIGFIEDEKDALFIFGAGIKYRIKDCYTIYFELRDFHKSLGVPFVTFPRSQAGIQGKGGSKYLDFQIRLHYQIN